MTDEAKKSGLLCKCTAHLDDVHESYFEHLGFALFICGQLLKGAIAVFIHALIPALFVKTGSTTLYNLCGEIEKRQAACAAKKAKASE
jgi:hypothetical protein